MITMGIINTDYFTGTGSNAIGVKTVKWTPIYGVNRTYEIISGQDGLFYVYDNSVLLTSFTGSTYQYLGTSTPACIRKFKPYINNPF